MMKYGNLIKAISDNDINEAIRNVEMIGEKREIDAAQLLIDILETTEDDSLRNAVALALADTGINEAAKPIITLLQHPKTLGNRGTLLYSLRSLEYMPYLDTLITLLIEGNFEVRRESLLLITKVWNQVSENEKIKYHNTLTNRIEDLEDSIDFLTESYNKLYK